MVAHIPSLSRRSWDIQSLDSRLQNKSHLHCSMDSLRAGTSSDTIHDADSYLQAQCNQIFIGMITMQYQAKKVVYLHSGLQGVHVPSTFCCFLTLPPGGRPGYEIDRLRLQSCVEDEILEKNAKPFLSLSGHRATH